MAWSTGLLEGHFIDLILRIKKRNKDYADIEGLFRIEYSLDKRDSDIPYSEQNFKRWSAYGDIPLNFFIIQLMRDGIEMFLAYTVNLNEGNE